MNDSSKPRLRRLVTATLWIAGLALSAAAAAMYVVDGRRAPVGSIVDDASFAVQVVGRVGFLCAGALIVLKRPRHVLGWTMLIGGLLASVSGVAERYVRLGVHFDRYGTPYEQTLDLPGRVVVGWVGSWVGLLAAGALLVFVPLMFPTGRLPSGRWRPVAWASAIAVGAAAARIAFAPGPLRGVRTIEPHLNPFGADWARWLQLRLSLFGRNPVVPGNSFELPSLALVGAFVVAAAAVGSRYLRAPEAERAPIRWFAASALLIAAGYAGVFGRFAAGIDPQAMQPVFVVLVSFGYLGAALATLFAIFRHRLFELDVVVRRTAALGGLTIFIAMVYAGTAFTAGSFTRTSGGIGWLVSVAGTTVAAAGLEPVRQRAEQLAVRAVYGTRLSPLELATQLAQRLAEVAPTEAPAELARHVGEGVGARQVVVRFFGDDSVVARWSCNGAASAGGDSDTVVVSFRSEPVAELDWTRFAGDPITRADRALMQALADQAGPALQSAAVMAELERRAEEAAHRSAELAASRSRLSAAQLDAQAQFQEDLQTVVSRGLDRLADDLRSVAPDLGAEAVLAAATTTAEEALRDLRRLGRGLYPTMLEGRGLSSALRGLSEETPAAVEVTTDLGVRPDAAVESTLFFTCADLVRGLEATANATLRLQEASGVITLTAAVPRLPQSVRQAVEDRVEAAGGMLSVGRRDERWLVRASLPAAGSSTETGG